MCFQVEELRARVEVIKGERRCYDKANKLIDGEVMKLLRHAGNMQKQVAADQAEANRLQSNRRNYLSAALDGLTHREASNCAPGLDRA